MAVCDLRFTKVVSRKPQTVNRKPQKGRGFLPALIFGIDGANGASRDTPLVLSLLPHRWCCLYYLFTTFRMVTPCGTVMRNV